MSIIQKICPCLTCFVEQIMKFINQKQLLQQKAFPVHQGDKFFPPSQPLMDQQIQQPKHSKPHVSTPEKQLPEQPTNLISSEDQQLIIQQKLEKNLLSDQIQEMQEDPGKIILNIPQYGAYYHLLKQKVHNAGSLLDIRQNCTQLKFKDSEGIKSEKQLKLKVWKKFYNSYVFQYELPCSYKFYSSFTTKEIGNEEKNKFIKQYRVLQKIQSNLSLQYICFEKIGMLQSRDFVYIKYSQQSVLDSSAIWELCVTPENDQQFKKPESSIGAKSGKLFTVSYIKEQKKVEEGVVGIKIRTYISVDISVGIEKVWERIILETKSYINELFENIRKNSDVLF